jgi:hypothetical protein
MSNAPTLEPATPEEVLDAVAEAGAKGRRIEIVGGGTKRRVGSVDRADLVLSTTRLDRIIDYAPDELVLTAQPGVRLADLRRGWPVRVRCWPLSRRIWAPFTALPRPMAARWAAHWPPIASSVSITTDFMRSMPHSNTAKSPTGPAPMIATSVSILADIVPLSLNKGG